MPDRTKQEMTKLVSNLIDNIKLPTDDDWSEQDIMYYCMVKCYTYEETMDN